MIDISNKDLYEFSKLLNNAIKDSRDSALLFSDYVKNVLNKEFKETKPERNKVIKIPKPIDDLLRGDLEPLKEIVIEDYPVIDGIPHWFKTSDVEVDISVGYINGDSRYPSELVFSDKYIHMLLGGNTGMGKSVSLNDIICYMLTAYAPWEITITLIDAKIVEFKQYGSNGIAPHIQSIAATSDTDYILSILKYKYDEMLKWSDAFDASGTGAKKLEDYREKTGLTIPRNIIIFDEMQAMLSTATQSQVERLITYIDGFARMGRSSGYHCLMTSQGVCKELTPSLLDQVSIRVALGSSEKVSTQILNNDKASQINTKGKMISNLYPNLRKNENKNVRYIVPYIPPEEFLRCKSVQEELGKEYGFKYNLNFYDEKSYLDENQYPDFVKKFEKNEDIMYLGEPSEYMSGADKVLKLFYSRDLLENITILDVKFDNLKRYACMLKENIKLHPSIKNIVFAPSKKVLESYNLGDLPNKSEFLIKSVEDDMFQYAVTLYMVREAMVLADEKVFMGNYKVKNAEVEKIFEVRCPSLYNDINRYRLSAIYEYFTDDKNLKMLNWHRLTPKEIKEKAVTKSIQTMMNYSVYNASNSMLEKEKLPLMYIWVLNLNLYFGFGLKPNNAQQESFRDNCMLASEFGIRFILTSSSTVEMAFLKGVGRYFIIDTYNAKDINTIGALDYYPKILTKCLGLMFDTIDKKCKKFKKIGLLGENLTSSE